MPAVARVNIDIAGGLITGGGQSKVYWNGYLVAVKGDAVASHAKHNGVTLTQSSNKVFINGKGVCRVGDLASCGDSITTGSNNTYSG